MTARRPRPGKSLRYETDGQHWDAARGAQNNSGRCVHAQAIMAMYGPESRPSVDTEHITVRDPETGDRYIYKTPHPVQASLLAFDEGLERDAPMRVRARLVQIKRRTRDTPISAVRKWALDTPELAASVRPKGILPDLIVQAYKVAHPGESVHTQRPPVEVREFSSHDGHGPLVTETGPNADEPKRGLLPGGYARSLSPKDRRTFGKKSLTQSLIADGWTPPSA